MEKIQDTDNVPGGHVAGIASPPSLGHDGLCTACRNVVVATSVQSASCTGYRPSVRDVGRRQACTVQCHVSQAAQLMVTSNSSTISTEFSHSVQTVPMSTIRLSSRTLTQTQQTARWLVRRNQRL